VNSTRSPLRAKFSIVFDSACRQRSRIGRNAAPVARRAVAAIAFVCACLGFGTLPARAQSTTLFGALAPATATPSPTPSPAAVVVAVATPRPIPTAIPLPDVAAQAESADISLRAVEADLAADASTDTVQTQLPVMTREIDARRDETLKILASNPSLSDLRDMGRDWHQASGNLADWIDDLTARETHFEAQVTALDTLAQTWQQTLAMAQASEAPPEVLQRIQTVIAAAVKTDAVLDKRRADILKLQNTVVDEQSHVSDLIDAVQQAQTEAVRRLFTQDSPPLWDADVRARTQQHLFEDSHNSFATQWTTLAAYATREAQRFLLHGLIFLLLVGALHRWRSHLIRGISAEPSLVRASHVFDAPVPTAAVLTLLASGWVYPQAPRLLWAFLFAAALLPTVALMRRLVDRSLYPILHAMIAFYFLDELRAVSAALPVLSRLLFVGEMVVGSLFVGWLILSGRLTATMSGDALNRRRALLNGAIRVVLATFIAAAIANSVGYVGLSVLLGNAVLGSAYLAFVLFAAITILDALVLSALGSVPLSLLAMVRQHRRVLWLGAHRVLQWCAAVLWVLRTLDLLSLRAPLTHEVIDVLTAPLSIGSFSVTLGRVIAFGITIWVALLLSRFLRLLLDEDVYPRFNIARGLPYAISTLLHYVVLLVGFFVAVAALGFDMTKFTILAGAFGVGLGFGMQNIVNNFVSGLILLFERPIKVGDVIQLSDASGVVERIGIRASVLRTKDGSEVIVPNGALIADRVTNWTLSNNQRSFEIPVVVATGSDPGRVLTLLRDTAAANAKVNDVPPPQALLQQFDSDGLHFTVRAWTDHFEEWSQIRSDIAVAINDVLAREGIAAPPPADAAAANAAAQAALAALPASAPAATQAPAAPPAAPTAPVA
jgi:small-conductance mechanosensitive channel